MAVQSTASVGVTNVANPYQGQDSVESIVPAYEQKKKEIYDTFAELEQYWRGRGLSSEYDKKINSFDDFIENYFEINKLSHEEYRKIKETGVKPEVDYRAEFKKYLDLRGCNESELKTLNETRYFTVDALKEFTKKN